MFTHFLSEFYKKTIISPFSRGPLSEPHGHPGVRGPQFWKRCRNLFSPSTKWRFLKCCLWNKSNIFFNLSAISYAILTECRRIQNLYAAIRFLNLTTDQMPNNNLL